MRKRAITAVLVVIMMFTASCGTSSVDRFESYLAQGKYDKALTIYEKDETNGCEEALITFFGNQVAGYNTGEYTCDEVNSLITSLKESGFDEKITSQLTASLDIMHTSKYAYLSGVEEFDSLIYDTALLSFSKVTEDDINFKSAQEYIDKINIAIEDVNAVYEKVDTALQGNDYDTALALCNEIIESGIIPQRAEQIIKQKDDMDYAWETAIINDLLNQNTYYNQVCELDDCMYFPHSSNNNHVIIKYDKIAENAVALPIAQCSSSYIIKDINAVGDYLYFIAGENVGTGRQLEHPYNIYRMNTDGSSLTCVKQGNFTNLLSYNNGFYAVSYDEGLIMLDWYLKNVDTITEEKVKFIQLHDKELIYTVEENNNHRSINTVYSYSNEKSELIKENVYLNLYYYDGMMLDTYKRAGIVETMEYKHVDLLEEIQLPSRDIMELYGYMDGKIYYAQDGSLGQPCYISYNIFENEETEYSSLILPPEFLIKGISFANESFLVYDNENYHLADKRLQITKDITLDGIDFDSLKYSDAVLINDDSQWYSDSEVIIYEEDFWYYNNDSYNVTIERRYLADCDTYVFVANIRTKDELGIGVESIDDEAVALKQKAFADILAAEHQPVLCTNGDFFFESHNPWTGIVIRNGVVYKDVLERDMIAFYPDGRLICYDSNDDITAEGLLADGVMDTMSFGPILMRNGEIHVPCYTAPLSDTNPRNGIGMVEPGHYVNILADGRQFDVSLGLTFYTYAELFAQEGCVEAYNLDGGQSTAMLFMGRYLNSHENDFGHTSFRPVAEIVTFGYSESVPSDEFKDAKPIW